MLANDTAKIRKENKKCEEIKKPVSQSMTSLSMFYIYIRLVLLPAPIAAKKP
jgi:hypothetical protein